MSQKSYEKRTRPAYNYQTQKHSGFVSSTQQYSFFNKDIEKGICPKCQSKSFKVSVSREHISVICIKCKRHFLGCWNEWVLNYD